MNEFGLTFHHMGLAVRRPEPALAFVRGLGYTTTEPLYDPNQRVWLIICSNPNQPNVEIIYPGVEPCPIDTFVNRHVMGIVYHACYVSQDLKASLAAIEAEGLRPICVSPPKSAALFGSGFVSFYEVMGMGLVEIIEHTLSELTPRPAGS